MISKKRILVTGAGGYVGGSIVKYLQHDENYDIVGLRRADLDLLDTMSVKRFFESNHFDILIHCAIEGGSRLKHDSELVLQNNLIMFANIMEFSHRLEKVINIGSGAEFDRRYPIHPNFDCSSIPVDPYGMSKYFISQCLRNTSNGYNLRIFGVFDENELDTRFIKTVIRNCINGRPSQVVSPFKMSFIHMTDFIWMLTQTINDNTGGVREFDCVYHHETNMTDLEEIAMYIHSISGNSAGYSLTENTGASSYVGRFPSWAKESNLMGLRAGIISVYDKMASKI